MLNERVNRRVLRKRPLILLVLLILERIPIIFIVLGTDINARQLAVLIVDDDPNQWIRKLFHFSSHLCHTSVTHLFQSFSTGHQVNSHSKFVISFRPIQPCSTAHFVGFESHHCSLILCGCARSKSQYNFTIRGTMDIFVVHMASHGHLISRSPGRNNFTI